MPVSHLRVRDFCFSLSKRLELRQALRFLSSAGQWSAIFMDEQRNQKPLKISPQCRHAHSFRILSWNSASTPPLFLPSSCSTCLFTYLTHWKFQCIASEPEIFRQIWFVWAVHKHFRWVLRSKLMTSLIISLLLAVFYQQSLSCEVINNSQGDLNSSNKNYFPLCLPWQTSTAQLLFEDSTSIFSMQIWSHQSFHTVCFPILAVPWVWFILEIAVLR